MAKSICARSPESRRVLPLPMNGAANLRCFQADLRRFPLSRSPSCPLLFFSALEGFVQGLVKRASAQRPGGLPPCDHQQVHILGPLIPPIAKPFPNDSFDSVSHHSVADAPTGTDPQALAAPLRRPADKHHELGTRNPSALARDPLELLRIKETVRPLKAAGGLAHLYLDATLVASRLRPFDRRRFKIARPERVFIRSRNPCFRSRLIRLG